MLRHIDDMPHDGTAFALTMPPTAFGFVWSPVAGQDLCTNSYGQYQTAPPMSAGTVAITYTSHSPGSTFTANIAGPISCDLGSSYTQATFHLETIWR